MDYAYDNSKPGIQVKVKATEVSYHSDWGQYSCTLCGEPVKYYRENIQKAHFRHKRGSIIAPTCELYANNISESSQNELNKKISGLPFYLKQISDSFKLYLEFSPVSESTLTGEIQIGQKVTLKNKKQNPIGINLAEVPANKTYRVPISGICDSYQLGYEIPRTSLSKIWGTETIGIFSNGRFFRIGDIYSRSIGLNGIITTDTSYYFISQHPVTNKPFLEVEESYSLLTERSHEWKIYKIRFTKITTESTQYARERHVQLLEKPPEFIPLWPPSIQNNREYIHQKTGFSTYHLKSLHESGKWNIDILNENRKPSDKREISLFDPVFSIRVKNSKQYISFFDTDNDLEIALVAGDSKMIIPYQQPSLEMKWMNKQILPESELKAIKNADLSVKSDMKCDIIRMRNLISNLIFRDELSILSFPDVSNGDTILIRHGLDILAHVYFRKNRKTADDNLCNNLSDEVLYQKLVHLRGTFMAVPTQVKYVAAGLENYPKTREYLKNTLKTGRISKQAADYLFRKYGHGEL